MNYYGYVGLLMGGVSFCVKYSNLTIMILLLVLARENRVMKLNTAFTRSTRNPKRLASVYGARKLWID
jgi:hypothetical protein